MATKRRYLDDNPPEVDAVTGPNRQYVKNPTESKTGFYNWWFYGRQKQLENAALRYRKHLVDMPSFLIRNSKIKENAKEIRDNYINSIKNYDEFIIPFNGIEDPIYKGFENARVSDVGKKRALQHQNAIEDFIGKELTTDANKALSMLTVGASGITLPGYNTIYYPELSLYKNIDNSTIIHERNHAGDYGDSRMVDMIFYDDVDEYGKKFHVGKKQQPYLLDGVKKSKYYDDAKEIKSRLMEFRYNNNLNPTHTYTIDEIKEMRNNKDTKDEELFNRYNDEFIYHLLNDIAYNDKKKDNENIARFGLSLTERRSLKNGGIYIKPSHRGRFTALKERTGHSTTWFKENGTPAQKKMATFALNAAKWKH